VSYTTLVKNGYLVQGLEDISFSSARVFANVLAFLFASGTPGATIGGANGSFEPERGRPRSEGRMTALGHQKRFPPARLSGGRGFQSGRCCRQLGRANFGSQTLSHVQCYVPRNTTRASTAFTP
jgi:hypothetical protein